MSDQDRNQNLSHLSRFSLPRRRLIGGAAALAALPLGVHAQTVAPAAGGASGAGSSGAGQSAVIDVDRARIAPIPIAIPTLGGDNASLGANITQVVTADLANCGLFKPLNPAGFLQQGPITGAPDWSNWSGLGAQALVTGQAQSQGDQVRIEFRLWDVLAQQQLQGTAYTASAANWRRIAHIIADVIYQRLLGEPGYFDTRIAYVSNTGPQARRIKRLAIMDQDGANVRYLTDGRWLVLTPRFDPKREIIAYMSYLGLRPRVYLLHLDSGRQDVLGNFSDMTFSPRFAPDGTHVIMSVTGDGGSDIITVDLASRQVSRLTSSGAIDVSPCYSPDGTQIVFNSDRGGDQQLYVMDSGGGNVRRISFGSGRYGTPVWSPRGDLIAFTRLGNAQFAIGVMHPDGSGERILAEAFDVEGPTFCPNGRVLMYWNSNGGHPQLQSIDITGFNQRVVPTPTDASDPDWSPLGS